MKWVKRILRSIKNFFSRKKVIQFVINDNLSNIINMKVICEGHKNDGVDMIWEDKYTIDPKLN